MPAIVRFGFRGLPRRPPHRCGWEHTIFIAGRFRRGDRRAVEHARSCFLASIMALEAEYVRRSPQSLKRLHLIRSQALCPKSANVGPFWWSKCGDPARFRIRGIVRYEWIQTGSRELMGLTGSVPFYVGDKTTTCLSDLGFVEAPPHKTARSSTIRTLKSLNENSFRASLQV